MVSVLVIIQSLFRMIELCEYESQLSIDEIPAVDVDISPDIDILLGDRTQLFLSLNFDTAAVASIVWKPAGQFIMCVLSFAVCFTRIKPLYTHVTVIDTNGCEAIAEVRVRIKNPDVWVPNVFSPNGDGINDQVGIIAGRPEVTHINTFQIFDRWGEIVFHAEDFQPGSKEFEWNGEYRGQKAPHDVYVYWAEVELINGQTWIIKGDITLIK